MREDYASIVNFIMVNIGEIYNAHPYFENIKSGFKLPAIYFPVPTMLSEKLSLGNQYNDDNVAYIQIFAMSNDDAVTIAQDIKESILKCNRKIPIVDIDGNSTERTIFVKPEKISRIEDCVAQIQLSWDYMTRYCDENKKANNINLNLQVEGDKYGDKEND